ncbi:dihydrofolate reductase family protein [Microbacterium sp.]|uniref:dihydrofolate reductase family protein n=1 Tax=Microbacterium sp. TaxID=51671 RepID=UPI003F978F67
MTRVRMDLSVSLDGYMPADPTPDSPMGADWDRLTAAFVATRAFREQLGDFSGTGTTGIDNRYVLTHTAPRPSIPMKGGTTFHFRNGEIEDVLGEATEDAGDKDVRIGGGYRTARDFLRAGLVDDLHSVELTHNVHTEVAESGVIHVTLTRPTPHRGRVSVAT